MRRARVGLEILCLNPAEYSSSLTAILTPEGYDEAEFRKVVLDDFNLSLGAGLAKLAGKVFRIGHLGDLKRRRHETDSIPLTEYCPFRALTPS